MQKARRITALLLALAMVVAVVAIAGCGGTKTETTTTPAEKPMSNGKLVKEGVLTVGSDTAFPPFESMNGSVAEGFDVDLADALAKEMGLTVNFTSQTFDTLIPQLKAGGTFDVIMSGMTITEDRKKEITFSTPYIDSNQSIAVVTGKFPKVDGNDAAAINTDVHGQDHRRAVRHHRPGMGYREHQGRQADHAVHRHALRLLGSQRR